jgi:hypothetical protein
MYYDEIPEGASRRYRLHVPDGSGGWKDLAGFAITGGWRTAPDGTPTVIDGALETDTHWGYVDILPTHTATPGRMYLDLKAALGNAVHVGTIQVRIANR